jgi:hypothetical protein
MSSIGINSNRDGMNKMLDDVSQLETSDLEQFLQEVAYLLAKRKIKSITKRESQLLVKINKPLLSTKGQSQYNKLYQKLREETITDIEHAKLLSLIKKREKKGVERLAALVELAQLRKSSPKALMQQMGLSSLSYV